MNNVERIAFAAILFIGGVALGMAYEHQRFLNEIRGTVKKHGEEPTPPPAPGPSAPEPTPQPEAAA